MQVFITGSPYETAQALDPKRLNKQILECRQIIKAIKGVSPSWANHPCTNMYREHLLWLRFYCVVLDTYKHGYYDMSQVLSEEADKYRPLFHTEDFFNQMKRRLYTKDNEHYRPWASLGESDVNWYHVNGEWLYYRNGKRIVEPQIS